jgi:hypothetical protein
MYLDSSLDVKINNQVAAQLELIVVRDAITWGLVTPYNPFKPYELLAPEKAIVLVEAIESAWKASAAVATEELKKSPFRIPENIAWQKSAVDLFKPAIEAYRRGEERLTLN